eukprot:TRINITY_DN4488_c1_g5_i1.p3 TRINITY_DN4488_c1_g5~~TRINITY_DN4488_c1_g5_i1.p3  ORF type:complete len:164 (+),score=30.90 TRINITY_DN4488_c1_g5_i1:624-1115(+)
MAEYEYDKRIMVYPAYLDVKKSWRKGRRVPKEKACEFPTAPHMYDCVTKGLKLNAELQMNKAYCRDWMVKGRIRVELFDDDGRPLSQEVPNKKTLFIKIAELVPRHPERQASKAAAVQKQQTPGKNPGKQSGKSQAAAKPASSSSSKSSSSTSSKKKQNKKKK